MSRGPGKWQRKILEETTVYHPVNNWCPTIAWRSVRDIWLEHTLDEKRASGEIPLFPPDAAPIVHAVCAMPIPKSDREAIRRAMRTLARRGAVQIRHGANGKLAVRSTAYGYTHDPTPQPPQRVRPTR